MPGNPKAPEPIQGWILDGVCGKGEVEGRRQRRRKKEGRADTVNWPEGQEPELLGWFPGYSAYLIIILWDNSVSLKRMTEQERTLLTIYLI